MKIRTECGMCQLGIFSNMYCIGLECVLFQLSNHFINNFLRLSKFNVIMLAPEASMAVCMQGRGEPKPCAL